MGGITHDVASSLSTRHTTDAVASPGAGRVRAVPAPAALERETVVHLGRVRSIAPRAAALTVEIVVVPGVLLYLFVSAGHAMLGLMVVCAWRTSCIVLRLARRIVVPATAWVAFGLFSARTIGGLAASSVALYLVVPVCISALQGAVFLGSAFTAKPLMGRLLRDFASSIPECPRLTRVFAQLSAWWGIVHLACAGVGAWAVTLPPTDAVAVTSVLGVICTGGSLAGCAFWGFWRTAQLPGLRVVFRDVPPVVAPLPIREPVPALA